MLSVSHLKSVNSSPCVFNRVKFNPGDYLYGDTDSNITNKSLDKL
ncbi:MAG: regulator of RNase E activity RraA [Sulfurimonas sp.]|jgi:regulator of RNase E activity RraA